MFWHAECVVNAGCSWGEVCFMAALWFLPRIAAGEVSRFTYAQLRQFRHLSITFQLLLRGKKSMNKGDGNRLCVSPLLSQLFFLSFIVFFLCGRRGSKGSHEAFARSVQLTRNSLCLHGIEQWTTTSIVLVSPKNK